MILIDKWWKRLIVSFLGIGVLAEMIHINTGHDIGPISVLFSMLIYLLLSFWYGFYIRKKNNSEKFVNKK